MLKTGVSSLMAFYGSFALAGAIVPWYFNIRSRSVRIFVPTLSVNA